MSTPRTISFRIDSEKVAELDQIAKNMDRDRSYLLNEAVERYLSEQRRFAAIESWNQSEAGAREAEPEKVEATA